MECHKGFKKWREEGEQIQFALEKHHSGYCAVDWDIPEGPPRRPLQGPGERQLDPRSQRRASMTILVIHNQPASILTVQYPVPY